MVTQRAYKFRFYPTPTQKRQLAIEFGHARYVWNWALERRTKAYKAQGESLNTIRLSRQLTVLKQTECPWLSEATASCHTQKLRDQDRAFKNFFAGRGKYPRFKRRHQTQSVRYQLDQRHVAKNFNAESKLLKLPKLGTLKLKWSQRMGGIPKMVTVSKDPAGRYFVSMACEVEIAALPARKNAVGVDVGVKDVVVTSSGDKSGAPKYTYQYARQLKKAQRRLSKKKKGSQRRRRQQQRVARIHARIADSRRDFLNQQSSKLINENQVICLEDLNIKGMLRNRRLSKAVADCGLYELRRQIECKAKWYGREVLIVDRWAPTSKRCSECGTIQESMPLKVREWECPDCGTEHDRDINAAKNVLRWGTAGSAETDKARGAVKTPRAVA
ncbi:transposase, IS605 OrfB family [Nitrosococcus halophilus Nc 4]|uniref:Transposase, IS605 OrfB family n=1 Tax=Nitrosococcus halophilus (strain Nc4) TaxID=472759 RepID=D5BVC4_NITHN|nr:RNA-guided endonuclease TnpB family protein [Nitrosococcus halophilus]ADE13552.1 transposase, IS605 OrfB family [Nitrosococcus halophilus Nc 4]